LTLYLEIMVVSGQMLTYTTITTRISYDTYITYYVEFSWRINLVYM